MFHHLDVYNDCSHQLKQVQGRGKALGADAVLENNVLTVDADDIKDEENREKAKLATEN